MSLKHQESDKGIIEHYSQPDLHRSPPDMASGIFHTFVKSATIFDKSQGGYILEKYRLLILLSLGEKGINQSSSKFIFPKHWRLAQV